MNRYLYDTCEVHNRLPHHAAMSSESKVSQSCGVEVGNMVQHMHVITLTNDSRRPRTRNVIHGVTISSVSGQVRYKAC